MSEKKTRTIAEIEQEYNQLCWKAGTLQYQISVFNNDLKLLNTTIEELNREAFAAKAAEKPAVPEPATKEEA